MPPPERPGTYLLLSTLPSAVTIQVGRLGRFAFPAGWYAYVGSARGPGGLAARLARHLRSSKQLHWHVDYLLAHARPVEAWYTVGEQARECEWARAVTGLPGAAVVAGRFGASDCRCASHLVHFTARPGGETFGRAIGEHVALGVTRNVHRA